MAGFIASLLVLLLAAPNAHAGSYVGAYTVLGTDGKPTLDANGNTIPCPYSGGTYTVPGPNGTPSSFSYALGNTQNLASGYGGDSGGQGASCTGKITTSYHWIPATGLNMTTDPPPSQVIVAESCSVEVTVVSPAASGTYDTGMGKSGGVSWSPQGSNTASATSVRYSVQPGGASVTLSPSVMPTAVAAAPGDASSVRYTATIYPVTINVSGTYNPTAGDYRALTGQQITANLASPYGLPYGTKVTGYTWSFSNYNPIKDWDPNAPGDGEPTQILPLLPTDYIGFPPIGSSTVSVNPISFYDEVASDTVTVKCAVTISLPDYTTQTVNTTSPQVTFVKPAVTRWDVVTGYVQGILDTRTGLYGLQLKPAPGSQQQGGEAWNNVTINVPQPFYGGQGCFAQLVTPNTTVTNDDPAKSPAIPNNGQQGLDNSFSYRSYLWTLPNLGANADGPAAFFSNYNATMYQGYNTVSVHDKFITWVMYKPPAVGSQGTIWVPLQSYAWDWSFTVKWMDNQWEVATSSPTAASDPGYKPTGVMNTPPQWSMIQTNSQ